MHHIGHETALDTLPALLDGDVTRFDQLKDVARQLGEGPLYVDGVTGRGLHVAHAVSTCQFFSLLLAHLPLLFQVALVADQYEDDAVRLHMTARLLQPLVHILERAPVGDVKKQKATH